MKNRSTAWKYIRRSPYQAVAAILTIFITFLLGGFFTLCTLVSVQAIQYFEGKPQITVFFADKAGQKEADALKVKLQATDKIKTMKFVSKEEALAIYKEQNKKDPLLLEMVTADILPASLEVTTIDPQYLKDIEPVIKESDGVEDIVFQKDVVDSLLRWTNAIRGFGGLLAGVLSLDSILIIMIIIGMKIALRREEIDILKLMGATVWYIRKPFILEGGLYGIFGSSIASIISIGIIIWLRNYILSFLGVIPSIAYILNNPLQAPFLLFLGILFVSYLILGFLLGSIGSLVAVGRYLKL